MLRSSMTRVFFLLSADGNFSSILFTFLVHYSGCDLRPYII